MIQFHDNFILIHFHRITSNKSRHRDEETHEGVEQKDWIEAQTLPLALHQILEQSFVVLQNEYQCTDRQQQVEQEPVEDQVHQQKHYSMTNSTP